MFSTHLKSALLCGVACVGLGVVVAPSAAWADDAASVVSLAETGQIVGVITDADRGGYLLGAEVRIEGHDQVAVSDREGRYVLQRAPIGRHTLIVSYVGRVTQRIKKGRQVGDVIVPGAVPVDGYVTSLIYKNHRSLKGSLTWRTRND